MAAEQKETAKNTPAYPAKPFAVQINQPELLYAHTRLQTGELKTPLSYIGSTELEHKLFLRQFTFLFGPETITHLLSPNHEIPSYGLLSALWLTEDYVKAVTGGKNKIRARQ